MDTIAEDIARDAAEELSQVYGSQLVIEVEKRLQGRPADKAEDYTFGVAESVAIAGLIVSIASFLYNVYKDQRDKAVADSKDATNRVLVEIQWPGNLDEPQKKEIINAVLTRLGTR